MKQDISEGFVWIVESLGDDVPEFLSVHTDKEEACIARLDYMAEGRLGDSANDYRVRAVKLNRLYGQGA